MGIIKKWHEEYKRKKKLGQEYINIHLFYSIVDKYCEEANRFNLGEVDITNTTYNQESPRLHVYFDYGVVAKSPNHISQLERCVRFNRGAFADAGMRMVLYIPYCEPTYTNLLTCLHEICHLLLGHQYTSFEDIDPGITLHKERQCWLAVKDILKKEKIKLTRYGHDFIMSCLETYGGNRNEELVDNRRAC